jgi:hypothetical protein
MMDLLIDPRGQVRCVYAEAIDLHVLGLPNIVRASNVEPDAEGQWWADLAPIHGPCVGPFERRSDALAWERSWLDEHWLSPPSGGIPMNLHVTPREFHTLLAALRLYQVRRQSAPAELSAWIEEIASNGGQFDQLDAAGIDRLCERLNTGAQEEELG